MSMNMKKVLLLLAASVAILIIVLQQYVGITGIWQTVLTIDPVYIALIAAIPFIGLYVYSYRWKLLLSTVDVKVDTIDAFKYALIGVAFNNLTPMMRFGGELIKGYMLSAEKKVQKKKVFAIITVDTVITIISLIGLIYVSAIGLVTYGILDQATISIIIASVIVPILLIAYFIYDKGLFIRFMGTFSKVVAKINMKKNAKSLEKDALKFREFMKVLMKRKDMLAKSLFISAVEKVIEIIGLYVIFVALGHPISLQSCAIVISVGIIAGNVPLLPGGLVLFESASILALGALGVPVLTATAAVLIMRFANYWLITIAGLLVMWGTGIKLSGNRPKAFKLGP
jgi:glycosyltransferase 2 family protein